MRIFTPAVNRQWDRITTLEWDSDSFSRVIISESIHSRSPSTYFPNLSGFTFLLGKKMGTNE